jgi:prepilin signal peptidase PulO-like enzyme (type II secretory pathway)
METSTYIYTGLLSFFCGASFASFSGLCAFRICRNESIFRPASYCDACGKSLSITALIPVFGGLLLHRRCKHCRSPVPYSYAIVELLYGACFSLLTIIMLNNIPALLIILCWSALCLPVVRTDIRCMLVPRILLLPPAVAGLTLHALFGTPFISMAAGIILGGGIFALIRLLKPGSMGQGDVEFGMVLGLYFGVELGIIALLCGSMLGGIAGAWMLITGKADAKTRIPYLPFLYAGGCVSALAGRLLLDIYGF